MSMIKRVLRNLPVGTLFGVVCFLIAGMVRAQQINGVPGAPDATLTIDGKQIPPPPLPFGGVIKENAADSTPYWPPRVVPPKARPTFSSS